MRGEFKPHELFGGGRAAAASVMTVLELVGGLNAQTFKLRQDAIRQLLDADPLIIPSVNNYALAKFTGKIPSHETKAIKEVEPILEYVLEADSFDERTNLLLKGNQLIGPSKDLQKLRVDVQYVVPHFRAKRQQMHRHFIGTWENEMSELFREFTGEGESYRLYHQGYGPRPRAPKFGAHLRSQEMIARMIEDQAKPLAEGGEVTDEMRSIVRCFSATYRHLQADAVLTGRKFKGNDLVDIAQLFYIIDELHFFQTTDKPLLELIRRAGCGHYLNWRNTT